MPGVVFLIIVPTANFERELIYGSNHEVPGPPIPLPSAVTSPRPTGAHVPGTVAGGNNNLNINLPENNNAILRLEVELRDKNAPKYRRGAGRGGGMGARGAGGGGRGGRSAVGVGVSAARRAPIAISGGPATGRLGAGGGGGGGGGGDSSPEDGNAIVPLEKVLEELLNKLEIEHVTWTTSKKGYFHQVVFPLQSGEPCETTLHCLTELGIGTKLNSSVNVLPCSVSYDALSDAAWKEDFSEEPEDLSKWNAFVESIKSKLTVKQVVDGVRAGGQLSFDYLLLIVTADSLAALGLIENNAPNITAAMLVSPLMGPVMSITFGTIISDRELMRVGFITLLTGMFISVLFGFIFGLICGTTEMPWGSGNWPTEEMSGRGNARALWMGVLWALTSGTGVAVALLQGSAGPLIGVAISASLLPPMVNGGIFWALACIWLIYPGIRIPHLKGEALNETSAYPFFYTDYLPTEFLINGIVSCLLTVINVICIFITAIIVLKIKEVSAPYTASPDLKRFWETDLRAARKTNRSTMRHQRKGTLRETLLPGYQELEEPRNRELDSVLEQALKEAEDDVTFKKVKRMSYSSNAAGELTQRLAKMAGLNKREALEATAAASGAGGSAFGSRTGSRMNSFRASKMNVDLKALDKLVSSLLEQHTAQQTAGGVSPMGAGGGASGLESLGAKRKSSLKLNRHRPTSRSAHSFNVTDGAALMPTIMESGGSVIQSSNTNNSSNNISSQGGGDTSRPPSSWSSSLERTPGAVRNVLQSIANAPKRLSQTMSGVNNAGLEASDEENLNLTQNYSP